MIFWASSESYKPAYEAILTIRKNAENYIEKEIVKSILLHLDMKLRYVPIIMPPDMHERYRERSRALIKQKIYDCAPHLDYETFVSGVLDEQLKEYFRGIGLAGPHLSKFGATPEQVAEFEKIILAGPTELAKRMAH